MDKKNLRGQEECIYRTGSTRPPKSYGGIIAVLLIVVIFLCGINGVLSLMNIRLFRQLQNTTDNSLSAGVVFSSTEDAGVDSPSSAAACTELPFGFLGCSLSGFDQLLYDLPQGVYVTSVKPDGAAEQLGIRPGDILVSLNDQALADAQTLTAVLDRLNSGELVQAEFIRDGKSLLLELRVD